MKFYVSYDQNSGIQEKGIILKRIILFVLLWASLPVHSQEISNSIVVGGVTSNSARFWLRVTDSSSVKIEAADNAGFENPVYSNTAAADAENNYSVILDLNGLNPETKYFYRAVVDNIPVEDGERSFTTFPIEGEKTKFSFAFGSCQQSGSFLPSNTQGGNVFREIMKHDIRFFLQLGDWTYPDTTDFLPLNSKFFAANYGNVIASYFAKYNKAYPMDSLLRRVPIDYIYDDHDYMNNNSSALTSTFYLPLRPNILSQDFVAVEFSNPEGARENSIKGYKEYFPSYPLANESRGIYHKFVFGNAEFFALDLRSQRDGDLNPFSNSGNDNRWVFEPDENHSILGRENSPGEGESQLEWFLNELKNSTADWKFIMSSVPFNIGQKQVIEKGLELQDSLLSLPELPADVQGIFAAFEISDSWSGFPADYDSVLSFIEHNNINNVIVLSGDSHNSAMDDGANSGLPEIMSGNLEITNSKTVSLIESFNIHIWNRGGQGISTDEFNNAFGKITVFEDDSLQLELIDEFGNTFARHTIFNKGITLNEDPVLISREYKLYQNHPNPFNPSTIIKYQLPESGHVKLVVYDMLGRVVITLVNGFKQKGSYEVKFDASNLSSGVYVYRIETSEFSASRKMILLK